ncbi:MAG TPA: hypothetical protein VJL58_11435, partial [Pyrinomonadaceae bacterium]|nr:hypothetical protein [Pyrinomonadaceae bacterium]
MRGKTLFLLHVLVVSFFVAFDVTVLSQEKKEAETAVNPVIWSPVDIKSRDLFLGPGGSQMAPDLKDSRLLGRQPGGNSLKYRIRDKDGNEWVAKIAKESQPETAAVRLLWGIGYKTETNYLLPKLDLGKEGIRKNVSLEARPKNVKRGERWMWTDNPFVGTKELDGLKIMMAMFNNWDLKDDNTAILVVADG